MDRRGPVLAPPPHPPWFQTQEDPFGVYFVPPPPLPPRPPRGPMLSPVELLATKRQNASTSIFLLGKAPHNLLRDYIGEYRLMEHMLMNHRHVYQRWQRNHNLVCWHDGWAWIIGPKEDMRPSPGGRGWLRAESLAVAPENVGLGYPHDGYWHTALAKFEIGDGYLGWLPAPDLRFAAGSRARAEAQAHEASELRLLDAAKDTVYVVGRTPCGLWREWLGEYRVMRGASLQSGRHVYVQAGSTGDRMMWYTDGVFWRLGASEFVGQPRGPFKVRDAALIPEDVQGAFEVGNGQPGSPWDMTDGKSGWLPAPGLRILTGAPGKAAMEADALPVCDVSVQERTVHAAISGGCEL